LTWSSAATLIGNVVYFGGGSLKPGSCGITDHLITFTLP
jgi:hypothetical protein